jgi:hypothetical protein
LRTGRIPLSGLLAAGLLLPQQTDPGGRLYGRVETASGATHVGFVRWFQQESSWNDLLAGSKTLPEENFAEVRRLRAEMDPEADRAARTIEFNGVRISWDVDDLESLPSVSESGVRFGHVARIVPLEERDVRLDLVSGETIEFRLPASGDDEPSIDVEVAGQGIVQIAWNEVRSVELLAAPPSVTPVAARVHGTLRDRAGNTFTGEISWAGTPAYASDLFVEPGPASEGLPFGSISVIERTGRSAARLTLASGETVAVGGANAPRFAGRTIRVLDPQLGQVQMSWNEVAELRLHPAETVRARDTFTGGRRLRGVVVAQSGEQHSGWVRWDNDEEFGWELLNGRDGNRTLAIELSHVREIRRRSTRNVEVTLHDGRTFEMDGSNDVSFGNKGVVVERDDGTLRFVDWTSLQQVTFEAP